MGGVGDGTDGASGTCTVGDSEIEARAEELGECNSVNAEIEQVEKGKVEEDMVKKLDVELRCGYYVPEGQPILNMIQPDHPSDAWAGGNS